MINKWTAGSGRILGGCLPNFLVELYLDQLKKKILRDEEWPPLAATRERPRTETKTQNGQK